MHSVDEKWPVEFCYIVAPRYIKVYHPLAYSTCVQT